MASIFDVQTESNNKIGTFESMLAGIGSGLIAIPKGLFSLGASLMDLGVNSGKAAAVEQWFDDLTEWDEKAEATAAGKITELLVNIGVPGGMAFKAASGMSKAAMLAAKNGKYVKLNNPNLVKAADEALELTAKGKGRQFIAGALGGGLAEGVFVGDAEDVGSFGDLLGGPTAIDRTNDTNAVREILNRVKFGTEGALFTGVLGGAGSVIKKLTNRNKQLDVANSKLDRWIDKVAGAFRSRSGKTQELFDLERQMTGLKAQDVNVAQNLSRNLELNIDQMFPFFRNIGNKMAQKERKIFLEDVNKVLLSGDPQLVAAGSRRVLNAEGKKLYEAYKKASFDPISKRKRYKTEEEFLNDLIAGKSQPIMAVTDAGPVARSTSTDGLLNKTKYTTMTDGSEMVAKFGEMDAKLMQTVRDKIAKYAPSREAAARIEEQMFSNIRTMRDKWAELFSNLGGTLGKKELDEFKTLFGNKFKNYLGSSYDIFQNTSIIPWMRYKPAAQAIEDAKGVFKQSADEAGSPITDLEAEEIVANILRPENIGLPKGMRMDRASQIYFKMPKFFVNKTTLDDASQALGRTGEYRVSVEQLKPEVQEVFNRLYGKQENPMQTMISGMAKLSMVVRRNIFYRDIIKKNDEVINNWMAATDKRSVAQPMFARSEEEARLFFGNADFRKIQPVDQAQRLQVSTRAAATTPFGQVDNTFYARNGVADAIEGTSFVKGDRGTAGRLYDSLVLYPKAASQIAKTILSPVTHLRNFVSAGAFAAANGIIPAADPAAIKQAYQALQTGLKGTRQQNDLYQELLELGVVNSNVRQGDLMKLLEDVNFGETMTADKGMRLLLKPLSKLKSIGQDLYTAEDDFWKIYSWAIEKSRIEKAFERSGIVRGQWFKRNGVDIKLDDTFLKKEAADIVKNNIPNYDYVSDFVKGLRKWPIGNFVSFPAEIARTGTNIVRRALREINETITLADGTVVKPFEGIGYTRLFGFGTTVAAVPMATVAAFQALYDVTDEEREALRRFVAPWSKNSTILPIKQEDGTFKYIDFSHANAYDTLIRPIQSVINAVQDGQTNEDGIMDDFLKGTFTAMAEFGQPFISESIWTEAVLDIIARKGVTRDGFQVYNREDTEGDKAMKIFEHLVKAQMPFSAPQLRRLGRTIEPISVITGGKYDEYGQAYEFGDEFQGLFGFRAVEINPDRTMKFKVADYKQGARDARSLFTRVTLKGGPIEPREIVDAYLNANRALFNVKKTLKQDMDAARLINISEAGMENALGGISNVEISSIDENIFRPMTISPEIINAFAENAARIGASDPFEQAVSALDSLQQQMDSLSLSLPEFPVFENPLLPIMQDTPITPTALNLPNIDSQLVSQQMNMGNYNRLTTAQKIDLLFG